MKLVGHSIYALIWCSISTAVLLAQNPISVKSSVDKLKVSQDETLTFKIEISGDLTVNPQINLPELNKDFIILSTAQSQSLSIKGKEQSRQVTFIYVLAAKAAGKFTIGEVLVKINKEAFKTQSIDIEVTPSLHPKPFPTPENPPEPSEESAEGQVIL